MKDIAKHRNPQDEAQRLEKIRKTWKERGPEAETRRREKIRAAKIGRPRSDVVRKKISESRKRLFTDPAKRALQAQIIMRASRWPRFEYLDAKGRLYRFRSRWELRYARHLDAIEVAWDYEPVRLLLSTDFRVGGKYVEIKGWAGWTASIAKVEQARADGHNVELILGRAALDAACLMEVS